VTPYALVRYTGPSVVCQMWVSGYLCGTERLASWAYHCEKAFSDRITPTDPWSLFFNDLELAYCVLKFDSDGCRDSPSK
jgi:hypothetical protein